MTAEKLKRLSFVEKIRLLPENEQWYLQGYVDRTLYLQKANKQKVKSCGKPTASRPA